MRRTSFHFLVALACIFCQSCNETFNGISEKKEAEQVGYYAYQLKSSNLPFEAYVRYVGVPFREGRQIHLSYEINLFNSYVADIELSELSIHDLEHPEIVIQKYDSLYFDSYFDRPGKLVEEGNHSLSPSEFGTVYVDLSFEENQPLPEKLFHRIRLGVDLPNGEKIETGVESAIISMPSITNVVLGPPFNKGKWMYVSTHHRDTKAVFDGEVHITQRHAIDWMALDEGGVYVSEDRSKNENWYTYGKEVLAVANGTVVGIKDSIPENIAEAEEMAVRMTRENLGGNWVLLDIGKDLEVFYAHLIPGSLKVKVGDKVKTGDVLGLLGNSGNSDCPHLHMHLETHGGGAMKGEGIPFHFKEFTQLDRFSEAYMDDTIWSKNHWNSSQKIIPSIRKNEYPRGEGVVEFK